MPMEAAEVAPDAATPGAPVDLSKAPRGRRAARAAARAQRPTPETGFALLGAPAEVDLRPVLAGLSLLALLVGVVGSATGLTALRVGGFLPFLLVGTGL